MGPEIHATTFGVRSTAELQLSDAFTPAAGVDWTYTTGTIRAALQAPPREGQPAYFGPTNQLLYADSPFWQSQLGLWTELRLRPTPTLLVIPGVRMDVVTIRLQQTPIVTADPRLAVRWMVIPPLTLKAGIATTSPPARGGEGRGARQS
jgi:hypothetical protein